MSSQENNTQRPSRSFWLSGVRRLVVKVGTSTLTAGTHALNEARIAHLAEQIAMIRRRGVEVILVTSGAIGVGMGRLALRTRPADIGSLQAIAAVGQSLLMQSYERTFRALGYTVAQVLVTADDLAERKRYVHFSNALQSLFRYGAVPIVNENDTISADEIRVGDNDRLSAHVANAVEADLLVILSDTDGVCTADPHRQPDAERIPIVTAITPELRRLAEEPATHSMGDRLGTGRLVTKIRAAEIVTASGMPMALAHGGRPNVLLDILDGNDVGTLFLSTCERPSRRKRWLAYTVRPKGVLVTDAGATRALIEGGKSLLPAGILDVQGTFALGDAVRCVDPNGVEFARGLVNYGAEEIAQIRGKQTCAIASILGYHYADEVIHRDNLALLDNGRNHRTGAAARSSAVPPIV